MRKFCDTGLVVSEDKVLKAIALAFLHLKIILEPGGAVALAAALYLPHLIKSDQVIVVGTGGNIDINIFEKALLPASIVLS